MQLLTGPAGSGKTFKVLEGLRAALRQNNNQVRLLVPTATMAQHLRNQMAREGFVFRPELIQTLHRFIESWTRDLQEISQPAFYLLVENCARRLNGPEFAKVLDRAGFHARLAAVLEECSAAGCDAARLERHIPVTPLSAPFVAVFKEVSRVLVERRMGTRSQRLALAASRIAQDGAGAITTIWLDGFFSLTEPELAVIKGLSKHAEIAVTLPAEAASFPARNDLLAMGFAEQVLAHTRQPAARELFVAPVIEREADEISRRILAEVAGGRLFREIGVIVHNRDVYVPLLRATLERFGIPARFYFDTVLTEHAAVRYVAGLINAMLGGWDHAATLTAMKLAPSAGISADMDRFDFAVREQLPGQGLEGLRQLAADLKGNDDRLKRLLDRLGELDAWKTAGLDPAQWRDQFARLRALYRYRRPRGGAGHNVALAWRSEATALDAFEAATEEAAQAFDADRKIPLAEFWRVVTAILRLMPLRVPDRRRDVVHVMSAHEARQWELPVVFVCGLVEGQFPRYHAPDLFLTAEARRQLKLRGIRLRSAEDLEAEERFLFASATGRATISLVLSYPKNDARGEQNLPSLFLDPAERAVESRPVRLKPVCPAAAAPLNGVRSPDLLQVIGQKHAVVRPTALESYLRCPFQFFGRHTLDLEGAPARPEERLDFLALGSIVHCAIAEWLTTRGPIAEIFDRAFRDVAKRDSVPDGYRTEMWRAQMLEDLDRFTKADAWPPDFESQSETKCEFTLDGGPGIRGRIDRLLKAPDGRGFVIDYKYSPKSKDKLKDDNLLQGPLYWLAMERAFRLRPAGTYYCSLRGKVEYAGWGEKPAWLGKSAVETFTPEWLERAIGRSAQAASEIAAGRTEPAPSDLALCRLCDYRDVCRYEVGRAAAIEEGA